MSFCLLVSGEGRRGSPGEPILYPKAETLEPLARDPTTPVLMVRVAVLYGHRGFGRTPSLNGTQHKIEQLECITQTLRNGSG